MIAVRMATPPAGADAWDDVVVLGTPLPVIDVSSEDDATILQLVAHSFCVVRGPQHLLQNFVQRPLKNSSQRCIRRHEMVGTNLRAGQPRFHIQRHIQSLAQ